MNYPKRCFFNLRKPITSPFPPKTKKIDTNPKGRITIYPLQRSFAGLDPHPKFRSQLYLVQTTHEPASLSAEINDFQFSFENVLPRIFHPLSEASRGKSGVNFLLVHPGDAARVLFWRPPSLPGCLKRFIFIKCLTPSPLRYIFIESRFFGFGKRAAN